jgi:hypothetical protein
MFVKKYGKRKREKKLKFNVRARAINAGLLARRATLLLGDINTGTLPLKVRLVSDETVRYCCGFCVIRTIE